MGDRKISIRTSVLEEKATACNMLCCYADELKDGFYPYVEQARPRPAPGARRPGAAASNRRAGSLHAAGAVPGRAWARSPSAEPNRFLLRVAATAAASARGGAGFPHLRREALHSRGRCRVFKLLSIFVFEAMPNMGC